MDRVSVKRAEKAGAWREKVSRGVRSMLGRCFRGLLSTDAHQPIASP